MKRILILDDDKNILEVLEETLQYSNYNVKLITESKNLFDIINEFDPHLLLLDFLLFDENGGEICFKLKNNPKTQYLPIILVSAYSSLDQMQDIYGCDAYISKPFDLEPLLETIHTCIENSQVTPK